MKAVPPDREKPIVHFSFSDHPQAMKSAIRDLKRSGFEWPPLATIGDALAESRKREHHAIGILHPVVLAATNGAPVAPTALDDLWAALKDAKAIVELLRDDEARARAIVDEATAKHRAVRSELDRAVDELKIAKTKFDAVFSS